MELKYSGKPTIKTCMFVGFLAGFVNMIFVVLLITPLSDLLMFLLMITFNIVLFGFMKRYLNKTKNETYISITDSGIRIDQGKFSKLKEVPFNDIETVKEHKNYVRIQEVNGIETLIPLYLLSLTGHRKLREIIEEKCKGKILK